MEKYVTLLSEWFIPEAEKIIKKDGQKHFALILDGKESINAEEILKICLRTHLSPLFFAISRDSLDISKRYSRELSCGIIKPKKKEDFFEAISSSAFSVTESSDTAFMSFLAHTPSYLSMTCKENRDFISEVKSIDISPKIFIPFVKGHTEKISTVGVSKEDFSDATKKLRAHFGAKLRNLLS